VVDGRVIASIGTCQAKDSCVSKDLA
jgi:hypothetical protein